MTALARLLRCSESHLHRIFEASSETPRRAIERYRIEEAQRLLASGSPERRRDRGWVAQAAGFSSAAHLQRVLRREAASHATQQGSPRPASRDDPDRSHTQGGRRGSPVPPPCVPGSRRQAPTTPRP